METQFNAIIIGGSYAGLSAAMTLGRALRSVLVIDNGKPANRQTPHAHNLLTHDGQTPASITASAIANVKAYPSISFRTGVAIGVKQVGSLFQVSTKSGDNFVGRKLLFATGIADVMPNIPGFQDCWGITVLHCPYCHGYEVRNQPTAIMESGEVAFEFAKMINNWTKDLALTTNGPSGLSDEQLVGLSKHNIKVRETLISAVKHRNGYIERVTFTDGTELPVKALYAKLPFTQSTHLIEEAGCSINKGGFLTVDEMQETSVKGIFAAGDCTTGFRSLSMAIAGGNKAGAMINHQLIQEDF